MNTTAWAQKEGLVLGWGITLKFVSEKWDVRSIGFVWLRIECNDGLLWTRSWSFGFHERFGIPWSAEQLSASQKDSGAWCEIVLEVLQRVVNFTMVINKIWLPYMLWVFLTSSYIQWHYGTHTSFRILQPGSSSESRILRDGLRYPVACWVVYSKVSEMR
jgi:hypothetical protein